MFLAIVITCGLNLNPSNSTCIALPSPETWSTEEECIASILELLSMDRYSRRLEQLNAYTYDAICVNLLEGIDA